MHKEHGKGEKELRSGPKKMCAWTLQQKVLPVGENVSSLQSKGNGNKSPIVWSGLGLMVPEQRTHGYQAHTKIREDRKSVV